MSAHVGYPRLVTLVCTQDIVHGSISIWSTIQCCPRTNECFEGNHHTITKLKKEKEAQIATQVVKEQYHPFVRRLIFCKLICSLRSILLNLHQIIICLAMVSESISECTRSFCSKAPFARHWLARNLVSSSTEFTASSCHTAGCLQTLCNNAPNLALFALKILLCKHAFGLQIGDSPIC